MITVLLHLFVAQTALGTRSDYNGFVRTDFKFGQLDAVVVEPKVAAKSRPWIWRLEFFDHRPMLDIAMLKLGYHLVHLEVGNTFGAPVALQHLSQFYKELTGPKWNLNRRVVLEGFSRGGLYAYNFAARNPDKVMAIYGDAPVCDFHTWPYGGKGGQRSDGDWNDLMKSYGFPSDKEALDYPFNPVDNLEVLAKARIPIIHVIGDADELVPVGPNTNLVETRYRAMHGVIQVIRKPGGHHHPHSLDNPQPIVNFLIKHANDSAKAPAATLLAAPNPESRYNSAGWMGRSWMDQFQDGKTAAMLPGAQLVLMGDSITQGFGGVGRHVNEVGSASYQKYLAEFGCANEGISGDRVQHVSWRIQHGALKGSPAKVVLIMIGINNYPDDSPSDVAKGIQNVARQASRACPNARVLVQPLMPAGKNSDDPIRLWCNSVNLELTKSRSIHLAYDTHNYLLAGDGAQAPGLVSGDGVHLTAAGYALWGELIRRTVLANLKGFSQSSN